MNWLKSQLAKLILRHAASAVGAWFVSKGFLTNDDSEKVYGAVAVLAAVLHSLWDKRQLILAELKNPGGLPAVLALAWPAAAASALLLTSGCKTDEYVTNESGSGMKMKLPVGWNGNNLAELDLTIGTFKHTGVMAPTSTNRIYLPTLAVVATTTANTSGNSQLNAPGSGTGAGTNAVGNAGATLVGGDAYILTMGDAATDITNNSTISTHAWQSGATWHGSALLNTNRP